MKINLIIPILILLSSCQKQEKTNIKLVPEKQMEFSLNNWLNKVCERGKISDTKRANYEIDSLAIPLIDEYCKFDTSFQSTQKELIENQTKFPYLKGFRYDLDSDNSKEIICLIGNIYSYPTMIIFSEINGKYAKIFEERFWLHNEYPYLKKIENEEGNIKLIRTGGFYYRGSGHWLYAYKYYRKMGERVFEVLESPFRATDQMNADLLNSRTHLINDTLISDKEFQLSYDYETNGSFILCEELKLPFEFEQPLNIAQRKNLKISLIWKEKEQKFLGDDFSKVEALMKIENDTLQWKEFKEFKVKSLKREISNYIYETIK